MLHKAFVHNLVLKVDQRRLVEEIIILRRLEERDESFRPCRGGLDVFDLE